MASKRFSDVWLTAIENVIPLSGESTHLLDWRHHSLLHPPIETWGSFWEACIGSWTYGSSLVATNVAKAFMYQSHSPKLKEEESGAEAEVGGMVMFDSETHAGDSFFFLAPCDLIVRNGRKNRAKPAPASATQNV